MTYLSDEARSGFTVDSSDTIVTDSYMLVGDNAYSYSTLYSYSYPTYVGDLDTYKIVVDIGSNYSVLAVDSGLALPVVSDVDFAILNRYGYVVAYSIDYGVYSGFTFTATDSLYYVQAYTGSYGYYGLRLTNNSITESNGIGETIVGGAVYTAALDYTADVDIYNFYGVAGIKYAAQLTSNVSDLYLDLEYSEMAVSSLVSNGSGLYTFTPAVTGFYSLHLSSNSYVNTGAYSFYTYQVDTTAPTVSTFSPADGTSSVAVASNIVLTFSEAIALGTGSIQVRAGSATGTVFETFDAATSSRLTFSGSTLTIDPTSSLVGGTNYYVTLASGSVKDTAGNSYTGTSAYDFTTVSTTTPTDGGMTSSAANEAFSGDSGTNTLICRNSAANYTLTETDTGWLISSTTDGNDTINNVERLQFTDLNLALDTDAANSAGGIYRLYKAALDRNPDLGGLGYWIAQADAGTKDAVRMATDFTYADEFKTLYGVQTADNYMTGEDITALVTKIYENVLDRAPDAGGRDYYAGQITAKSKTVGQVLAEISDSA